MTVVSQVLKSMSETVTVPKVFDITAHFEPSAHFQFSRRIRSRFDELATEYEGRIKICKMDVDENREVAAKFNVRGIPTLIMFKDGDLEATKVGAVSRAQLVEFIDSCL